MQLCQKLIFISFFPDNYHFPPPAPPLLLTCKTKIMSAIYILISVSFLVAIAFLAAFIWSIKNGQYDDDYSPSVRMLKKESKPLSAKDK